MCTRVRRATQVVERQTTEGFAGEQSPRQITAHRVRKFFAAAALLFICACKTLPLPMVPALAVGRWEGSKDGAILEMTDTGIFVIELKDGTTLVGRCSFVQERITMRYQIGVAHCPQEPGEYTWTVDASTLVASEPADTCVERRALMDQLWNRASK